MYCLVYSELLAYTHVDRQTDMYRQTEEEEDTVRGGGYM